MYMMLDFRGPWFQTADQTSWLGIRGLMAKPRKSGFSSTGSEIIENPILSNFKEGLNGTWNTLSPPTVPVKVLRIRP